MKEHLKYIDILRVVATVVVISIHVASMFISLNGLRPGVDRIGGYGVVRCFSAVDIFLMISGMLLLGKTQAITYSQVFGKYIPRVLWSLLVFALPMCIIEQVMVQGNAGIVSILNSSIVHFLTGNSWTHMWYMYMLLGLYLIVPLFHNFVLHTSKPEHTLLAIAIGLIAIIIPNISMITGEDMHHYLTLPTYIGTFYLGFYLRKYCPDNKIVAVVSLICLATYVAYAIYFAESAKPIIGPDFIMSIVTAGAMFCIFRRWPVCSTICSKLAPHCFCIYLVHPVFLNMMFKVFHIGDKLSSSTWLNMIIVVGTAFLLSFAVSYFLHKIPFFKKNVL